MRQARLSALTTVSVFYVNLRIHLPVPPVRDRYQILASGSPLGNYVVVTLAGIDRIMFVSDVEFSRGFHRPRPRFLTGFGWFAVLAIMAVAVGAVLGFAT